MIILFVKRFAVASMRRLMIVLIIAFFTVLVGIVIMIIAMIVYIKKSRRKKTMIELQTLVGELTIEEFTKLCGIISANVFLIVFVAVLSVTSIIVLT